MLFDPARIALKILIEELAETECALVFHRQAGRRGNIEAMIAGHKRAWLRDIIRKIEAAVSHP